MTTNLRDLLQSKADSNSDLDGKDLVAKKVKKVVWMDMMYNFGCAEYTTYHWLGSDTGCRGSAQVAVMDMPDSVEQVFSSLGGDF
jgi:hypothetical protein